MAGSRNHSGLEKTSQCIAYMGCLGTFGLSPVEESGLRKVAEMLDALLGVYEVPGGPCRVPNLAWGQRDFWEEVGLPSRPEGWEREYMGEEEEGKVPSREVGLGQA